jgi:hypothetical protein
MSSPDATQGKNVQQKQEKSKNEWLLQDHSRVVGNPYLTGIMEGLSVIRS